MRYYLIYLALIVLLLAGIYLVANPYVEYLLYICVTVGGHTTCRNEVVRSFKSSIFYTGVVSTITSIGQITVLTIVMLVLKSRKKRRESIVNEASKLQDIK
jgi:hypothetical protein